MKKVVIAALIVFVIGIAGTLFLGGNIFAIGPKETIDMSKSFDANEINKVNVETDIGEVIFTESASNKIDIRISGEVPKRQLDQYEFKIEQNGGTLNIESLKDTTSIFSIPFFDFSSDGKRIVEVSLPKDTLDMVEITSDVGNIDINELEVETLQVSIDVGDINVQQFVGTKAKLKSNVGDIHLSRAVGAVDLETDTGDIEVEMEEVTEDVNVKTDVGDVNLSVIQGNTENIGLDMDSDVGDTNVNGGAFLMGKNNNGPTIQIRTDVGDITVEG